MSTLIKYALHRSRVAEKDEKARHLLPDGVRIEPEVIVKLTEKLDKANDSAKSVHINYGLFLPNFNYLDNKWFLSHLEDVFPRDSEKIDYWEVAWDGYMYRNDFFGNLYAYLKPYYNYALDQIKKGEEGRAGSKTSQQRMAGHLALLYMHGEEILSDENSIIKRFFTIASDNLRAAFVKTLTPVPTKPPIALESNGWKLLKEFWHWRFAYTHDTENVDEYKKELATFLLWVPYIPEPLKNYYEMIETSALLTEPFHLRRLFEYLIKVINLRFNL